MPQKPIEWKTIKAIDPGVGRVGTGVMTSSYSQLGPGGSQVRIMYVGDSHFLKIILSFSYKVSFVGAEQASSGKC